MPKPAQARAVLDSHAAALELRISKVVCDSEARLRDQIRADVRAICERIESLSLDKHFEQHLSGSAARPEGKQEAKAQLEADPAKTAPISCEVPLLVDKEAERKALQARPLDGARSTWTQSLQGLTPLRGDDGGVLDDGAQGAPREQSPKARPSDELRGWRVTEACSRDDLATLKAMKTQSDVMKNSHDQFHNQSRRRPHQTPTERWASIVEIVSTLVLVSNVVWMAVETELSMEHVKRGEQKPGYFVWIDLCFVIAMCAEVAVKLALFRSDFFLGPGRGWNVFDVVLIILAGVDLLLSAANLSFIRVLRGLRAIRATRVIRTATMVPELRLMFASVIASVGSLFWAFVLILLTLFLCAMGVQQTVHSTLETSGAASQHPQLLEYYGSLPVTMLSLFMAISGGADWKDLAEPLVHMSRFYAITYVLFIILMVFGLLNILTAVFVEKTSNIGHIDPELVIEEKFTEEMSSISQLLQILGEADADETGTITKEEFEVKLEDHRFRAQMQLLDLNILEVQGIFQLLDSDRSGAIEIEELVYGLMRMKGNARNTDMHSMLYDTKRLLNRFVAFQREAEASFKDIYAVLAAQGGLPAESVA